MNDLVSLLKRCHRSENPKESLVVHASTIATTANKHRDELASIGNGYTTSLVEKLDAWPSETSGWDQYVQDVAALAYASLDEIRDAEREPEKSFG